jgi:hypothetical protein
MENSIEHNQKNHEHPKEITIIVNGRQKMITKKELSFEDIVALAFENPTTGGNTIFTVTYRKGEGNKPEGTLTAGHSIKVKDEMIFNVTSTDKS